MVDKESYKVRIFGDRIQVIKYTPEETLRQGLSFVFLHDGLGCVEQCRAFPENIVAQSKLPGIAYDRLGHGESDPLPLAREKNYRHVEAFIYLRAIIENQNLERVILVGHSDGANIALLYASKFNNVAGIVAMAPHVYINDLTRKGVRGFASAYEKKGLSAKLERFHGDKTQAVFETWQRTWLSDYFSTWDIRDEMKRITAPLLLIQGTLDEYGTVEQLDAIASRVSGPCEKHLIKDCNHFPHVTAREEVQKLVHSFVKKNVISRDRTSPLTEISQ